MDLQERWSELVARPDDDVRPLEAAAIIAARRRTGLVVDDLLAQVEALAQSCPEPTLDGLRRHLFVDLGFAGDTGDYHHERTSLLDQVLERRRGLPILLSVITADVGRQLSLPLAPVALPGHVLVGSGDRDRFVDPFHRGRYLDAAGCRALVADLAPSVETFDEGWLEPAPPLAIVSRMLANLASTYSSSGDRSNLRWVLEMRAALPDAGRPESIQLATVLAALGDSERAAGIYEDAGGDGEDAVSVEARRRARILRARAN